MRLFTVAVLVADDVAVVLVLVSIVVLVVVMHNHKCSSCLSLMSGAY